MNPERLMKIISIVGLGLTALFIGMSIKSLETVRLLDLAILCGVVTCSALIGALQADFMYKIELLALNVNQEEQRSS